MKQGGSVVITQEGRGRPSRAAILRAVDEELQELAQMGGLPKPFEAEGIWEGIWYEETHNSTAIEGNTLVLSEVQQLLGEGRAVGDKELREYLEVQAYADAAKWVYAQGVEPGQWGGQDLVALTEVRHIHRLAVEPVWRHFPPDDLHLEEGPGSFRRHDIHPLSEHTAPPPFPEVPALITDWLGHVNDDQREGHPIRRLAVDHAAFEKIHPFRDGNGRTGRLVLNLLLLRHGYPPAIILKRKRGEYLTALARADRGDPGALTELVARAVKDGLDRFVLPALAGPQRMLPLSALVTPEVSAVALRYAAIRGRLRAQHRAGKWYSTKQLVEQYVRSRRQGRRGGTT
jgi:Fic family protein